jgi:hypothetical protein
MEISALIRLSWLMTTPYLGRVKKDSDLRIGLEVVGRQLTPLPP